MEGSKRKTLAGFLSVGFTGFLFVVFTLANPSGIALAQVKRVLIAEQVEEPKKKITYSEGDKLSLRSQKTGNTHSGQITAFSDSSLVLEGAEFLFSEILFIQDRVIVTKSRKRIGFALLAASLVTLSVNLMSFSENDDPFPMLVLSPGLAVLGGYFLFHKPVSVLSPQTGWQLRIIYVE